MTSKVNDTRDEDSKDIDKRTKRERIQLEISDPSIRHKDSTAENVIFKGHFLCLYKDIKDIHQYIQKTSL